MVRYERTLDHCSYGNSVANHTAEIISQFSSIRKEAPSRCNYKEKLLKGGMGLIFGRIFWK
jgi:hypothetical protein